MEAMTDSVVILEGEMAADGPVVVYVNRAFEKLTGYRRDEVEGRSTTRLQGEKTDLRVLARLRRSMERQEPFIGQMYSYRKDGTAMWLSWEVAPMKNEKGEIGYWVAVERDETERNRLQREILEVGARERRRFSYDLHDSLGQQLAGISFLCKVLESELEKACPERVQTAAEIRKLVQDAAEQTRTLAKGLAPMHGEPVNFPSLLKELAVSTTYIYRIPCKCIVGKDASVAEISQADHLYYIASEAVTNAVKHASATKIVIRFELNRNHLELSVSDNGVGVGTKENTGGMGQRIMAYRAESIGGSLEIVPTPSGGTRVVCSVPIEKQTNVPA